MLVATENASHQVRKGEGVPSQAICVQQADVPANALPIARREPKVLRDRARLGEHGYTLVEMLVVLAIIGLIVGLVGPRVLGHLSDSKEKAARIQIEGFSASLDIYFLDNGRYPTSSEGLAALVQKPNGTASWKGPYLKSNSVPSDPWGRAYLYVSPGQHGGYDIVSLGVAGSESGAETQITSWQR